jgi:hypothetical protein
LGLALAPIEGEAQVPYLAADLVKPSASNQ